MHFVLRALRPVRHYHSLPEVPDGIGVESVHNFSTKAPHSSPGPGVSRSRGGSPYRQSRRSRVVYSHVLAFRHSQRSVLVGGDHIVENLEVIDLSILRSGDF